LAFFIFNPRNGRASGEVKSVLGGTTPHLGIPPGWGLFFACAFVRERCSDEMLGEEPEQQLEVIRVVSKKPASEVSWE